MRWSARRAATERNLRPFDLGIRNRGPGEAQANPVRTSTPRKVELCNLDGLGVTPVADSHAFFTNLRATELMQ